MNTIQLRHGLTFYKNHVVNKYHCIPLVYNDNIQLHFVYITQLLNTLHTNDIQQKHSI